MKFVHSRWIQGLAIAGLSVCSCAVLAAGPDIPGRVESSARRLLAEQARLKGLLEPTFEIAVVNNSQPLQPCRSTVTVESVDTQYLTRMRFKATCPDSDGWRRDWIVHAEVSAKVLVAAADVPANQPLVKADLMQARHKLTDMGEAVSTFDAAVGLSSTRALRTGQLVQARFLGLPLLIKQGDSVNIMARSGAVEVNVSGEAMDRGRRGDIIRVRNTSTGKIIRARVLGGALVEPENMPGSSSHQSKD